MSWGSFSWGPCKCSAPQRTPKASASPLPYCCRLQGAGGARRCVSPPIPLRSERWAVCLHTDAVLLAAQPLRNQPRKDQTVQQGLIFNRNLSKLIRNQPGGLQSHSPHLSFTRPATPGPALCPWAIYTSAAAAGAHAPGWASRALEGAAAARWKPSGY